MSSSFGDEWKMPEYSILTRHGSFFHFNVEIFYPNPSNRSICHSNDCFQQTLFNSDTNPNRIIMSLRLNWFLTHFLLLPFRLQKLVLITLLFVLLMSSIVFREVIVCDGKSINLFRREKWIKCLSLEVPLDDQQIRKQLRKESFSSAPGFVLSSKMFIFYCT